MALRSPPSGRNRHRPPADATAARDVGPKHQGTGTCHDGCGPAGRHAIPSRRLRRSFSPAWARPLRRGPRIMHDVWAITPVVGTIVILGISTVGIAAVMTWGLPNVQQAQAVTELDGVRNQFYALDQIADGVMRGGAIDKASEGTLSIPKGQIERTNGTLFVISWAPNVTARDDRFWLLDVGGSDHTSFRIHAEDATASGADGDFVLVERYKGSTMTSLTADGGSITPNPIFSATNNPITVDLGTRTLEDQSTRIRVIEEGGNALEGPVLMEAWILPSGSLGYVRDTNFGLTGFRLENSAVVSEMETGDFLLNQPLGTVERDADDNPLFLGLFQMILADDPNRPGVEAAGTGSFPILFALQANNLRADGVKTEAVHIDAIGPRAHLWETHWNQVLDIPRLQDVANNHPNSAQPGLYLLAPTVTPTARAGYDFVLLESLIGVSLQVEVTDLGRGS